MARRMNVYEGDVRLGSYNKHVGVVASNYNQAIKRAEQSVMKDAQVSMGILKGAHVTVNKLHAAAQKAHKVAMKRHTVSMARMKKRR